MAKRIFIIAAPGRDNEAAEAEQILREYDYDVVNPRIIEEYEKEKARLGLFNDDFGWLRRDIKKLVDCDAYCLRSVSGDPEKIEYEEMCLRNEEVKNVCEYVRTYTSFGVLNNKDIDIYLCHCENVLNGNLDGLFLTFHKELEK